MRLILDKAFKGGAVGAMVEETGILHEPTVLVLGAGASKPYGFPLGSELKTASLDRDDAVLKALTEVGYGESETKEFLEALRFTIHPTVDIFLEKKTNFRGIGSYFIAGTIGRHENHDRLFTTNDWYRELYEALGFDNGVSELGSLSVVTLNYDRSLEHFLAKYIDYNCPHSSVESARCKLRFLPIIHAHGSLGAYPEVEYGRASSGHGALRQAAESIKIVSDRLEDSPDFRKAQEALSNASHIVLLGFGYDKRTLQLLLQNTKTEGTKYYGTAFGIGGKERADVMGLFKQGITLGATQQGCKEFVRQIRLVPDDRGR